MRQAITVQGYVNPTPIQDQAIPEILAGRDVMGTAQTGTGKTAAFVLPLLDRLTQAGTANPSRDRKASGIQALILAPTRELADQINQSIESYSQFLQVSHTVVYGGVSQYHQVRALSRGVDILVATPGRLLDLMEQGHIDLSQIKFFILDEVDRMLDMGFAPDIKKVLQSVPAQRQTLFFSATLSHKILEIANTMVNDPVRITIEPEKPAVDRIRQSVYFVSSKNKANLLSDVLKNAGGGKAIIFTQMKFAANRLAENLEQAGIRATAIHGNKSQAARTRALTSFKQGKFQVLVATDVAARGIDVDDVTHVVNYDMPVEPETYVHRIGRTARAGADGDAISFCSAEERALLRYVERHLKKSVPVVRDHDYHCEKASKSQMAAPKYGGGGNRGRSNGKGGNRRRGKPQGNRGRARR